MKTTVYLLRHGEVFNPEKLLYGRLPKFSLSLSGKKHIEQVAEYFKDKEIKYIYTSPLLRARQTAQIIGKRIKIRPKISRLINEVNIYCQGISLEIYKNQLQKYIYDINNISKGQESLELIKQRMLKFLKFIQVKYQGKNILVVSHGDPIMVLKAYLENTEFSWDYKKRYYLQTGNFIKITCNNLLCKV